MAGRIWYVISEERLNYLLNNTGKAEPEEEQQGEGQNLLYLLPPKYQQKGKRLLEVLQQSPSFTVYPDGSFGYRGKRIQSSHIIDLVTAAVQSGFKRKANFTGLKEFALAVRDSNVPRSLLSSSFVEVLETLK